MLTIGGIKLDTFIVIEDANVHCELKNRNCELAIRYGEKIPVKDLDTQVAGSAPNVAVGLTRMNKKSGVLSVMGKDLFFPIAKQFLKEQNVSTKYLRAEAGVDSGFAAVINYKGESTQLVSQSKTNYTLTKVMPRTKWVHVSELGGNYVKLFTQLIREQKKNDLYISFNPGTIQLQERRRAFLNLVKSTHVLFLNRKEAHKLIGSRKDLDIKLLMKKVKKLGPSYVVITDGRNGAYAFDGDQLDYAPMFPGARVEATGAGDAFSTGFLGALMHGKPHREALMWGSVNAASAVHEIGPTKGLLTHTEIQKRLKKNKRYSTKEL
jgi:sugar/nucleoside kinase (ribokinase family)